MNIKANIKDDVCRNRLHQNQIYFKMEVSKASDVGDAETDRREQWLGLDVLEVELLKNSTGSGPIPKLTHLKMTEVLDFTQMCR